MKTVYVEISKDIQVFVNDATETVSIKSNVTGSRVILDYQELEGLTKTLNKIVETWSDNGE